MISYDFLLAYTLVLGIIMFTIVRISFNYTNKKYNKLYDNMIGKHLFTMERINTTQNYADNIMEMVNQLIDEKDSYIDEEKKEKDNDNNTEEKTNNELSYKHYTRLIYDNEIYVGNTDSDYIHTDPTISKLLNIRNYLCSKKRTNDIIKCILVFSEINYNICIDMNEAIDMLSVAIVRKGRGNQCVIHNNCMYTIDINGYKLVESDTFSSTEKILRIYCKKVNNSSITIIPLTLTEYIKIPDTDYYTF